MNAPNVMNTLYILPNHGWEAGAAQLHRLADLATGLDVRYLPDGRMTERHIASAEIIFGSPDPALLQSAPRLKWLHLPSAGADPYTDLRLYANNGITLTTSAGVYGVPMAEHILMLFLMLARGVRFSGEAGNTSGADPWSQRELHGATVLLLGLGDVGRTLAARLSSFGTITLGMRRNLWDKPPNVDELFDIFSIDQALARADFVACSLPLTPETAGLLNKTMFEIMKPGAIFVNVGRGAVVDTAALTEVLATGRLAGAGLDVTDPDLLPPSHPLRSLPNVILTEHTAGESLNVPSRRLALFEKQLVRYLSGRSLHNTVDFFRGY